MTTEKDILQTPDAAEFITVTVFGRYTKPTDIHVFEMSAGEIADCTQELLQVATAFYANRAKVEELRKKSHEAGGAVTVQDVMAVADMRSLTSALSNAVFVIAAKASGEKVEFLRDLSPASFMEVAAAVIGANAPFFLSLPTLFGVRAANETPAQAAA